MMALWQHDDWPDFHFSLEQLGELLARVSREQGRLSGRMEALGIELRGEAHLRTLTRDVVESSEIDGEHLARNPVRSSIATRLGVHIGGLEQSDRRLDGAVEVMLDATLNHQQPLTIERLLGWHASLFPNGHAGARNITVGDWRKDAGIPNRGDADREGVQYQPPPADRLAMEMTPFVEWFESPATGNPLLAAGLAHLWFVTIRPFDDGNDRIARAITDMALSRAEGASPRFYSLSAQIRREHRDYQRTLQWSGKATPDITRWQTWFLFCLERAIVGAHDTLGGVFEKARFRERFAMQAFNERQSKVLNRLLDGFEEKLSTSIWAKIAECSKDTAHRDIVDLVERGALVKEPGGGRSTRYSLSTKFTTP